MFYRRKKTWMQRAQKAIAFVALLSLCAMILPIPVENARPTSKDHSTPFPCQDCGCGCHSPEKCWTSCCCHSPAERLEWAKRNGVTPPSYAILKETNGSRQTLVDRSLKKKASCTSCSKCSGKTRDQDAKLSSNRQVKRGQGRFAILWKAMKCQGKSSDFGSIPWALVPDRPVRVVSLSFVETHLSILDCHPVVHWKRPDVPPPRFLSAI